MRDIILSIRADESIHRDVNHRFVEIVGSADKENINSEIEVERVLEKDPRIRAFEASKVT